MGHINHHRANAFARLDGTFAGDADTGTRIRSRSSNPAGVTPPKIGPVVVTMTKGVGQGSKGPGADTETVLEPSGIHSAKQHTDPSITTMVEDIAPLGLESVPPGAAVRDNQPQANAAFPLPYVYPQYPYVYLPYPYMPSYPPPEHYSPATSMGYHQQNLAPLVQLGNLPPPAGMTPPVITFPHKAEGDGTGAEVIQGDQRNQGPVQSGQRTIVTKKVARNLELQFKQTRNEGQSETGISNRGDDLKRKLVRLAMSPRVTSTQE